MAKHETAHSKGIVPAPVAFGCELIAQRATFTVSAALAANDIIKLQKLPAGHVPVDLILDADDTGTTGTLSVGLLNAGETDLDTTASGGAAWLTGGDVATAATGLRADAAGLRAMSRVTADQALDRQVAIKVETATTATSGTIGLTLIYRAA